MIFLLNWHIFVAHKISRMRSRISQLVSFILFFYYSTGDIISCVAYEFISKSPWNRLLDVVFVFVHNFAVKFDVFMSPLVLFVWSSVSLYVYFVIFTFLSIVNKVFVWYSRVWSWIAIFHANLCLLTFCIYIYCFIDVIFVVLIKT